MSKFKVGDKAQWIREPSCGTYFGCADAHHITITSVINDGEYYYFDINNKDGVTLDSCLGCLTGDNYDNLKNYHSERSEPMARRTFKLIKDTPDVKKGALFQEKCDDGDQDYQILEEFEETHVTAPFEDGGKTVAYGRAACEDRPNWFIEVFKITPEYMTREELDQFEAFKKGKKSAKKKRTWTAAQRKAQSERVKARHAAKAV